MFNSIRKSIAKFIAPTPVAPATIAPKMTVIPEGVSGRSFQAKSRDVERTRVNVPNGKFTVSDLQLIGSDYLRDAVAGLGAWSALARMFAAYEKQTTSPRAQKDWTQYEQFKDEFHQWNAATSPDKQMGDDEVIIALDKIADVPVQKGNDQTDAIIARVLKKSVDELRVDRLAKAERQTAARKEMLAAIAVDVWNNQTPEGEEAYLSSIKVVGKATQTLEWIAKTWTGEPASIAAECLLIEADLANIERMAEKEEAHEGESQL